MQSYNIVIDINDINKRLDKIISDKLNISRNQIIQCIKNSQVLVNNAIINNPAKIIKLIGNININYEMQVKNYEDILPHNIPIEIVFEDDDIVIINKSDNLTVHPAPNNKNHTLVNAILFHISSLSDIDKYRPGIIHRIDKDTSGLLVVAKNNQAHEILAKQFRDKTIKRYYYALVWGRIEKKSGTISANIGRHPKDRKKNAVHKKGKHAITHFKVVKELFDGKISLLECKLETGRTHQIRVHMQHINHPILGDQKYGHDYKYIQKFKLNNIQDIIPKRQLLHAKSLLLLHPKTNLPIQFNTNLPDDINNILNISN